MAPAPPRTVDADAVFSQETRKAAGAVEFFNIM
jgi:hypothetical protein